MAYLASSHVMVSPSLLSSILANFEFDAKKDAAWRIRVVASRPPPPPFSSSITIPYSTTIPLKSEDNLLSRPAWREFVSSMPI